MEKKVVEKTMDPSAALIYRETPVYMPLFGSISLKINPVYRPVCEIPYRMHPVCVFVPDPVWVSDHTGE